MPQPLATLRIALCAVLAWSAGAAAGPILPKPRIHAGPERFDPGFAVVEMFTAPGSGSCVKAEHALSRIADEAEQTDKRVYLLSFDVGDAYRKKFKPDQIPSHLKYQLAYAKAERMKQLTLPQIHVNGKLTPLNKAARQIDDQLREAPLFDLGIRAALLDEEKRIHVQYRARNAPEGTALNIALVRKDGNPDAGSGPRPEPDLRIVQTFVSVFLDSESRGVVNFKLPNDLPARSFSIVGYAQDPQTMKILNAVGIDMADY